MRIVIEGREADLKMVNGFLEGKGLDYRLVITETYGPPGNIIVFSADNYEQSKGMSMHYHTFLLDGQRGFKILKAKITLLNRTRQYRNEESLEPMAQYAKNATERLSCLAGSITTDVAAIDIEQPLDLYGKKIKPCQINWILTQILMLDPFRKYFLLELVITWLEKYGILNRQDEMNIKYNYMR